MSLVRLRIIERGTPKAIGRRGLNRILKESYEEPLRYWHEQIRPEHFKNSARTKYHYVARSGERGSGVRFKGSYTWRKLIQFGHTRPLERTGQSRRASQQTRITTTSKGGRAAYNVPTFNRRPDGWRETLRDEFTRIAEPEEDKKLTGIMDDGVDRRLNAAKDQSSETI